jgi:UDP-4-amino-4,6-dideoxy-N-acetyl-beta-L-altrosamine transaminase
MIPYGKQWITDEDINEVIAVLKSDFITQGPKIKEFEDAFAKKVGSKYAVAVSNGTAALHIASLAININEKSRVITTPMTFAATANSVRYCQGIVDFADILQDGLINPIEIKKKITSSTRAIYPVDYSGHPTDLSAIRDIAVENQLAVVEDACHALGAKYHGNSIGDCKYSDITVFSFHPVKHITTGEGGMLTTNSAELYEKLMLLRSHGITKDIKKFKNENDGPWYHEMHMLGYNYRITDLQAALGLAQLKKLDMFVNRRREIAKRYHQEFEKLKLITTLPDKPLCEGSYHLFPILLDEVIIAKKKEIVQKFHANGIGVQILYIPVYFHPYYQELGYQKGICPQAEMYYRRMISLPMYPLMTNDEVQTVVDKTKKIIGEYI